MVTEPRPRAREAGVVLGRLPCGPHNAITDVPGIAVGHVTLVSGDSVRTGVTAIVPHPGNLYRFRPQAAHFVFNGYGKSVGLAQLAELGVLETPLLLTNTLSIWTAANALVTYSLERNPEIGLAGGTVNPVIGECSDAFLNDIRGRHVTESDCLEALQRASTGPVEEGNVGAGTGMSCLGFKGGIGTSSRVVRFPPKSQAKGSGGEPAPTAVREGTASEGASEGRGDGGAFTLGCLVLANFGRLPDFRLDGVPVGAELEAAGWAGRPQGAPSTVDEEAHDSKGDPETQLPGGSIMMNLATDAPLTSRQLTRIARRATLGLARTGSVGAHGSGDFVLAFSVADLEPAYPENPIQARKGLAEDDRHFGPLFQAAAEATEEAIINALFAAQDMTGRDGHARRALPVERVIEIMRRHGRLR